MEWWINNSNQNLLGGVDPPRLPDDMIVSFLKTIPGARESFNRLVPQMLPEEQARLWPLAETAKYLQRDYKAVEDDFQARLNKAGVRTAGRYGGTRRGGNV